MEKENLDFIKIAYDIVECHINGKRFGKSRLSRELDISRFTLDQRLKDGHFGKLQKEKLIELHRIIPVVIR